MTERTFYYVPRLSAEDWMRLGWLIVADLGPTHGEWSVLGEWLCKCPVIVPVKKKK